jgi:hypothetical protein
VVLLVDRPPTEQHTREPECLTGHPARALARHVAEELRVPWVCVLVRMYRRTQTAHADVGVPAGVVPRVADKLVCTTADAADHRVLAVVDAYLDGAEPVEVGATGADDNHGR